LKSLYGVFNLFWGNCAVDWVWIAIGKHQRTQKEEHKGGRDKNWEGEKNTPPLSFARPIEGL